jgi:uncharacterized protein (TIGR02145 family)
LIYPKINHFLIMKTIACPQKTKQITTFILFSMLMLLISCEKNEELTYIKGRSTVTDIDGNTYKTIIIGHTFLDMGTQEWMAENLIVTSFRDGTPIPFANNEQEWHVEVQNPTPHFAWNSFDQQNKGAPYGAFYNFHTVVDPRGLCPTGWRVPTIDDWEKLIIIIGGHSNAGGKVKSLSPHWQLPNVDATDEIEFGALPGGLISGNGSQIFEGEMAWFWSSTSFDDGFAYAFGTSNTDPILGWSPQPKWDGRNIRCVKE